MRQQGTDTDSKAALWRGLELVREAIPDESYLVVVNGGESGLWLLFDSSGTWYEATSAYVLRATSLQGFDDSKFENVLYAFALASGLLRGAAAKLTMAYSERSYNSVLESIHDRFRVGIRKVCLELLPAVRAALREKRMILKNEFRSMG